MADYTDESFWLSTDRALAEYLESRQPKRGAGFPHAAIRVTTKSGVRYFTRSGSARNRFRLIRSRLGLRAGTELNLSIERVVVAGTNPSDVQIFESWTCLQNRVQYRTFDNVWFPRKRYLGQDWILIPERKENRPEPLNTIRQRPAQATELDELKEDLQAAIEDGAFILVLLTHRKEPATPVVFTRVASLVRLLQELEDADLELVTLTSEEVDGRTQLVADTADSYQIKVEGQTSQTFSVGLPSRSMRSAFNHGSARNREVRELARSARAL